jgi:hypothetical protein
MLLFVLFLALLLVHNVNATFKVNAIALGAGAFSSSGAIDSSAAYSSANCQLALTRSIAPLGANTVQLLVPLYVDSIDAASHVYAIVNASSPLRTPTTAEIVACAKVFAIAQLHVLLSIQLLPDYSLPGLCADPLAPCFADPAAISASNWTAFMQSFNAAAAPYIATAGHLGASVEIARGADAALLAPAAAAGWQTAVGLARHWAAANVLVSFANAVNVTQLSASLWSSSLVDAVGVAAHALRAGVAPALNSTERAQQVAWQAAAKRAAALAAALANTTRLLVTPLAVQSRPGCENGAPWVARRDQPDCSGWLECYDLTCQANAYEAFFRAFEPLARAPWMGGVVAWLLRIEPSNGGTSDSDWTVAGKDAQATLQRWFNGQGLFAPIGDAVRAEHARQRARLAALAPALHFGPPANFSAAGYTNGFVYGGPDEWSFPGDRFDSAGSDESLRNLINETSGNAIEVPVMWYYDDANSTDLYPIGDFASSLRTSTDAEVAAIVARAKARGLKTCLTPMIDPNYDLPDHPRTDDADGVQGHPGWRGLVGHWWGSDCGHSSKWATWHWNYRRFILRYAKLAQQIGADEFLVSHELESATQQCAALWRELVRAVRKEYSGVVGAAFNAPVIKYVGNVAPWARSNLDYAGVDCYYNHTIDLSAFTVPWQQASQQAVRAEWASWVRALQNVSVVLGNLPLICTEVGFQSRPFAYSGAEQTLNPKLFEVAHQWAPRDCSIGALCANDVAQAIAVQAMFEALYAQSWFHGFYLWLWRADPTAGGAGDDSYTPRGKLTAAVIEQWWQS